MKRLLLTLLILHSALLLRSVAQDNLPRTALVMGVGDYGGAKYKGRAIQNLPGITTADLPGMAAKLEALGFEVTVVANPTLSQAKTAVDTFSARIKARPGVSLFYFSGHGGEYEGKNFLITRGASIASTADLSDEALSAQRVLNGMEESGAQVNLAFLDCCREDLGKNIGGAEMAPLRAKGSFIGFATRSGDFADPDEQGSPYTRFLLKHLDKPGVSVTDMYGYVAQDVKDYSKRVLGEERTPGFYSELAGAPFYLVPVKFTPGGNGQGPMVNTSPLVDRPAPIPARPAEPFAMVSKNAPFTNSLGMGFVPAGTPGVLFSVWETRVKDFESFVEESGHDAISENSFGTKAYTLEKTANGSTGWEQKGGSWRDPRFPSKQTGEHPVVCVSYLDAEVFCAWLTKKERTSGMIPASASYRLPTHSEWSRAVGGSEFPWGDHWPPKSGDGNYCGQEAMVGVLQGRTNDLVKAGFKDSAARTGPVGMFAENRFGLYDMGGNVWEWCSTWYTADLNDAETKEAYSVLPDDKGGQTYRVLRGVSWYSHKRVHLQSACRLVDHPVQRNDHIGFRVVLVVAGG
jgi:formylglycine-generating enzyme required for sulfatase activity